MVIQHIHIAHGYTELYMGLYIHIEHGYTEFTGGYTVHAWFYSIPAPVASSRTPKGTPQPGLQFGLASSLFAVPTLLNKR